jgi:SAM-dependent methyltransferase
MKIRFKAYIRNLVIDIKYCNNFLSIFMNPFFLHRFFLKKNIFLKISKLDLNKKNTVLDIGCGEQPYYSFFSKYNLYALDIPFSGRVVSRKNPNIFFDGTNFPIKNNSSDLVVLIEVLEHIENYSKFIEELVKIMKPKSYILISTPFFWPLHEEPFDFFRFTPYSAKNLSKKLKLVETKSIGNFYTSFFQTLNSFLYHLIGKHFSFFLFPIFLLFNSFGFLLSNLKVKNPYPLGHTFLYRRD